MKNYAADRRLAARSMSLPAWHEVPISKTHDRSEFDCGDADMNVFLARYVRQSHEQSAASRAGAHDPAACAPRCPSLSAAADRRRRIDRRAGLGGQLLAAAARRWLVTEGGGILLINDAKNECAADWNASVGAGHLLGQPQGQPLRPAADWLRAISESLVQ